MAEEKAISTAVAIDAMGGDNAPEEIVDGAILASAEGVNCILVGDEARLSKLLGAAAGESLKVVHATEVVAMDESPIRALRKKDSSLAVSVRLLKDGHAQAVFSAGNSAAYVGCIRSIFDSIADVQKSGIAINMPTLTEKEVLLIDAGASADCRAQDILRFARMGKVFAEEIMGRDNPSIGLINIGEEESKGNEMSREAHKLLRESSLNFTGNIEGNAIADGTVDVVVCDGFIGNTILKVAEGSVGLVVSIMKNEFARDWTSKLGALLLRPAFRRVKKGIDWKEWGGGVLLGPKGNVLFGHGRSDAVAVCNALKLADRMAHSELWTKIEKEMTRSEK